MRETYYQELFDTFYKPLINFAVSNISQRDVAEDIVQEVFIYMWDKNIICENELVLRTYLYRSVLNRCKNYLRNQQIHNKHGKILWQESDKFNNEVFPCSLPPPFLQTPWQPRHPRPLAGTASLRTGSGSCSFPGTPLPRLRIPIASMSGAIP